MSLFASRRCGFSLVEVTLALGVLAFAIIPIVGLMGVAMNTGSDAVSETSLGRVLASVEAELSAQAFEDFSAAVTGGQVIEKTYNRDGQLTTQTAGDAYFLIQVFATADAATSTTNQGTTTVNLFRLTTEVAWPLPATTQTVTIAGSKGRLK